MLIAKRNRKESRGRINILHYFESQPDKHKETGKKVGKMGYGRRALIDYNKSERGRNNSRRFLDKNPMWNGGSSFEPYNKLKEEVRKKFGETCQRCGINQINLNRKLDVHHIDYNKKNSCLNNLIPLCMKCNFSVNSNREFWKSFFEKKF